MYKIAAETSSSVESRYLSPFIMNTFAAGTNTNPSGTVTPATIARTVTLYASDKNTYGTTAAVIANASEKDGFFPSLPATR